MDFNWLFDLSPSWLLLLLWLPALFKLSIKSYTVVTTSIPAFQVQRVVLDFSIPYRRLETEIILERQLPFLYNQCPLNTLERLL